MDSAEQDELDWVDINPAIMLGKPVLKGTRIPVAQLLEDLASGETVETFRQEHPGVTEPMVRDALRFVHWSFSKHHPPAR